MKFVIDQNKLERWEKLGKNKECMEFGFNHGCRKDCPVYEAEACMNQRSNEVFFKWLDSNFENINKE